MYEINIVFDLRQGLFQNGIDVSQIYNTAVESVKYMLLFVLKMAKSINYSQVLFICLSRSFLLG